MSSLAIAVSRAGGLGFLGAGTDASSFRPLLEDTISSLAENPIPRSQPDILPIGIGFICWGADLDTVLSVFKSADKKPAAAWLFAPKKQYDLLVWTEGIRRASNNRTKIWIQVGTVAMAIDVAQTCKPDVLVIQGSDAGGHGLAQSSSIISLLPECADALVKASHGHIPLIAAGGIANGRGVAAALTLGAVGVSLGTRFLATPEAVISDGYRKAVIAAKDGGINTARTNVYDRLRGTTGWPETYNGRGILNQSFWDSQNGVDEKENKRLYKDAMQQGDAGWGDKGRITTYAGTSVGLVDRVVPAAEVVRELLRDVKAVLAETNGILPDQ